MQAFLFFLSLSLSLSYEYNIFLVQTVLVRAYFLYYHYKWHFFLVYIF